MRDDISPSLHYKSHSRTLTVAQDDLTHLDISNGGCVNTTISQNVTFGVQGLPFGINTGPGKQGVAAGMPSSNLWTVTAAALAVLFYVFHPVTL